MIRGTYSDPALHSISAASACWGLVKGQSTLRKVCALGLVAMIENRATMEAPNQNPLGMGLPEEDKTTLAKNERLKVIAKNLVLKLIHIWQDGIQVLFREGHEWAKTEEDEFVSLLIPEESKNMFGIMDTEQTNFESTLIGILLDKLKSSHWDTREHACRMFFFFFES
ncbi:hypothetical protein BDN70DRAFT_279842 [Pholiota conissans]|uniref:Uncharacterized protein n=1 Tax=Pholiota conissans TaxID=109636 RepID=A0A9P5Z915_9AGAR|nr:hypothetical protein BDN70DRAFT_279842 [Pholiota conissans]